MSMKEALETPLHKHTVKRKGKACSDGVNTYRSIREMTRAYGITPAAYYKRLTQGQDPFMPKYANRNKKREEGKDETGISE